MRRIAVVVTALAGGLLVSGCADHPGTVTGALINGVRTESRGSGLVVSYIGGSCDTSARLRVTEKSNRVDLNVEVTTHGNVCDSAGHSRTVSATLDRPLGQRGVWIGGQQFLPLAGTRLRTPTTLPPGFGFETEQGMVDRDFASSSKTAQGQPVFTTIRWTRSYADSRVARTRETCPASRGTLEITAVSASTTGDIGVDRGRRTVGVATARLRRQGTSDATADAWTLAWPAAGGTIEVTSSGRCGGDHILGPAELLTVARSLRPA